jgi:hypothetical protein
MTKMFFTLIFLLAVPGMFLPVQAQTSSAGDSGAQSSALNVQQDTYLKRMISLMGDLNHAKTAEHRKEIPEQMRQISEEYRAANPPKELTPADMEARRQKIEVLLKKDSYRWEIYQLHQSIVKAENQEDRRNYHVRMQSLKSKHAAEEEVKLTPEQRTAAQASQAKNIQIRSELKPLLKQRHGAKTSSERKTLDAQIIGILKKYR